MTNRQLKIQTMQQLKITQRKELAYMEKKLDNLIAEDDIPTQWKTPKDCNLSKFIKHSTMITQTRFIDHENSI